MKKIKSLLLLIFLLVTSASFTQVKAPSSDSLKWEKSIKAFELDDLNKPPVQGGIEFVGSSSIRKWVSLEKDFQGYPVFNRGFGGSQIIDSYNYASRIIIPYAPRKIFFHAGDNDLASGKSPDQVYEDFIKLVTLIHSKLPKTAIYFISLKPSEKRWRLHLDEQIVNKSIEDYAKAHPFITYIDCYTMVSDAAGKPRPELFADDKLHLSEAGYKLLTEKVRPYLEK
jgi:lysophospholipase L1-like esterase